MVTPVLWDLVFAAYVSTVQKSINFIKCFKNKKIDSVHATFFIQVFWIKIIKIKIFEKINVDKINAQLYFKKAVKSQLKELNLHRFIYLFTVSIECGGTSREKFTYLSTSSSITMGSCSYAICKSNTDVCRIRFDFEVNTFTSFFWSIRHNHF